MSTLTCLPENDQRYSIDLDELEARLRVQMGGRVRDFHLAPSDSGLILLGHATTYYAKQLALHAVMGATEWPIAANDIEVS